MADTDINNATMAIMKCDDSDMLRTFEIISDAFGHEHPYIESVFPAHETPAGRASGGERMLAYKRADPNTTFLKLIDTKTGTMLATAKWNVYKGVIPPELELDGDFWHSEDEKELAQYMFREYLVPRRKAICESGGNLVCRCLIMAPVLSGRDDVANTCQIRIHLALDILTVDPKYQRRGVGRMLVKWGTAIADRMGVEVSSFFQSISSQSSW